MKTGPEFQGLPQTRTPNTERIPNSVMFYSTSVMGNYFSPAFRPLYFPPLSQKMIISYFAVLTSNMKKTEASEMSSFVLLPYQIFQNIV